MEFSILKEKLYLQLSDRNKIESLSYDDIIKNYKDVMIRLKNCYDKTDMLERENSALKLITGDPLSLNELNHKIQSLEKELADTLRENKINSSKILELVTDNYKMKENIDNLNKQIATKTSRILELEQIIKDQDDQLNKLNGDNSFYKSENIKLEKQNISLNENLNIKIIENEKYINEIINIKNSYVEKMNEMVELVEIAKRKKEAADIYYDEKKVSFSKIEPIIKDEGFQYVVEDVTIPNKLKIKLNAHKKNITSLKFNSFGTNFITTGVDTFTKYWDSAKNKDTTIYSGFTSAVTSATFDHTEQFLFAGSMDKTAKLWSLKNNKLLTTFTGHIEYINCVSSFYSSEKGLTGSSDRTVKEWDFNTTKMIKTYNCISSCSSIAVSYDDSFIITGHLDGSVKLWSNNEKPEKVIELHDERVNYIELIKNENQILTISKDHNIKLYDFRKMQDLYVINDSQLNNYCESNITISSDRKYFACGSSKGEIYIFNLLTGKREEIIDNKSTASILALQWRPYHSQIYVGDSNGSLSVWGNA